MQEVTPTGEHAANCNGAAHGFLSRLVAALRQGLSDMKERAALKRELEACAASGELDEVLRDLGVERSALDRLVRNFPSAPRQREAMARKLGVDLDKLAGSEALRRIEQNCALCSDIGACRSWLDEKSGSKGYHDFCPNAGTFEKIAASQRGAA